MSGYHQMIKDLMTRPKIPASLHTVGKWAIPTESAMLFTAGGHPVQPPPPPHTLIYNDKDPDYNPHFEDLKEVTCEILFELDGWQIEHYEGTPTPSEVDWISHDCPVEKWRYRIDQWQLMGDGVCPACCTPVPDEVMGLWKLKNFDKLPAMEEARHMSHVRIYPDSHTPEDAEGDMPWV